MFSGSVVKVIYVLCQLTAFLLTVEGTSKPIRLPAFFLVQIQNAENVTGPSKIYTIETINITNTTRNESILQLSFLKHQLLPGDKLTFYDGNFTSVLREYTASTETPALSFFTTLPDAKVVFTANTSDLTITRSFIFLYRTVPKDTDKECNYIFYGRWGNVDSSKYYRGSKRCRYTVTLPPFTGGSISLIFDNLTIPVGERLLIWKTTRLYLQPEGNPVKVFPDVNNGKLHYIGPRSVDGVILEFNSTTQFKIRFQNYERVIEEFGESGEITLPIRPHPKHLKLKYWITVPRGHVKLTVHDLYLPKYIYRSTINVYRFNERKRELVRSFDNSSTLDTSTVISDSNRLAVTYNSYRENSIERFRITYSMLETAPKTCDSLFPNVKKSKLSVKLYEGWEETYSCVSGYGNENFNDFTVLCLANGSWIYRKGGECRKICPSLDSLYNLTARGLFRSFDLITPRLSGDNVTFSCQSALHRLTYGMVTCTSSGMYSAPPPYCKEEERNSNDSDLALTLSLSLSVPFVFVLLLLVIVYYVTRRVSAQNFVSNDFVNSQQRSIEMQENSPLGNGTKHSTVVQSTKSDANGL